MKKDIAVLIDDNIIMLDELQAITPNKAFNTGAVNIYLKGRSDSILVQKGFEDMGKAAKTIGDAFLNRSKTTPVDPTKGVSQTEINQIRNDYIMKHMSDQDAHLKGICTDFVNEFHRCESSSHADHMDYSEFKNFYKQVRKILGM